MVWKTVICHGSKESFFAPSLERSKEQLLLCSRKCIDYWTFEWAHNSIDRKNLSLYCLSLPTRKYETIRLFIHAHHLHLVDGARNVVHSPGSSMVAAMEIGPVSPLLCFTITR